MTALSNYTSLPCVRKGLATYISTQVRTTSVTPNPVIPIKVNLQIDGSNIITPKQAMDIEFLETGDITGIQASTNMNNRSKVNVQNFEPYLLASMEFAEEVLP